MEEQNNAQAPDVQPTNQYNPEIESPTQPPVVSQAQAFEPAQAPSQPAFQQPPYAQPSQPMPVQGFGLSIPQQISAMPPTVSVSQPKSKKKWLIPVIALGVVVLAGGSASAYYFGIYQRPENVLLDAFNKASAAKAIQSDAVVTLNKNLSTDITLKNIKFKTAKAANSAGMVDAAINLEYKGKALSAGGKGMVSVADNTAYFQINNLKQSVTTFIEAAGMADQVPQGYFDGLDKLQDQWVKVTIDDLKKNNQAAGKDFECTLGVFKKHSNDSNKEILDLYSKNPFITVKENVGVKNGQLGYKLGFDEAKSKSFGDSIENTQIVKDLKACNVSGTSSTDTSDTVDSATNDNTVYTVWVDQWSHELKKVEFSGDTGTGGEKMAYSGNIDITYDPNVKVDVPGNTISLDEYIKRYNGVAAEMGIPDSTMLEDQYVPLDDTSNSL